MSVRDRLSHVPRRRWVAVVVALALVAVAALAVTRRLDGDGGRPPPPTVPPADPVATMSSGFEGTSVRAEGWTTDARTGTGGKVQLSGPAGARSGRGALDLEVGPESSAVMVRQGPVPVGQGLGCDVGGWSRVSTGEQRILVSFRDGTGREISSREAVGVGGPGVWSRATVRTASPSGTRELRVSIVAGPGSKGTWDDVDVSCGFVRNGGFEQAVPQSSRRPADWAVTAAEGTSVRRVESEGRGHALRVQDGSETDGVTVRSQPTPVPAGLEITVSALVRRTSGEQGVVLRFLSVSREQLVQVVPLDVDTEEGAARPWSAHAAVPESARWVTVEVSTDAAGRSLAVWDDLDVRPRAAAPARLGKAAAVSDLEGHLNTATSQVVTVDGRALLYTVVSGVPAELQVADVETGRLVDRHAITGAPTGWALATAFDQSSVYVGGASGHLLRYDPRRRTLTDLGRATPRAEVVFGLAVGADGRVWGGSYPGGELWSHDPRTRRFTSIAPVGAGSDYARSLALEGTTLHVGTGSVRPTIVSIDLRDPSLRTAIALPGSPASGFVTELRSYGRLLAAKLPDGSRGVYDVARATWDTPVSKDAEGRQLTQSPSQALGGGSFYWFSNGRLWRVRPELPDDRAKVAIAASVIPRGRDRYVVRATLSGTTSDWLLSYDGGRGVVAVDVGALPDPAQGEEPPKARWVETRLELEARPMRIKSLGVGSDGTVWAGGFGGASLSSMDTRATAPVLTPRVGGEGQALVGFGEVEGLASNGPYEFFGTYTGARIFRYDKRRPWVDGENPSLVSHLGPSRGQDRPVAWATAPGRTYFGTIPRYGRLGGALGWFVDDGPTPVVVPSPVPDHSIVGLAAKGTLVYGTTSRWGGLGSPPKEGPAQVFAYDTARRRLLWTAPVAPALQSAGSVLVDRGGRLFVLTRSDLTQLDPSTGRTLRTFPMGAVAAVGGGGARPSYADTDLAEGAGLLWAALPNGLYAVDPATGTVTSVVDRALAPPRVEFSADAAYLAVGPTLLRVTAR